MGNEESPVKTTIEQPCVTTSSPPQTVTVQQPQQQQASDLHRLRIATRAPQTEGSWDEDSAISQTSSTSGYRESYPVMHLRETLDASPKQQEQFTIPPLASPDIHDLQSTSSGATTTTTNNNFPYCDNSSPDCSLNENNNGEKQSLLGVVHRPNKI